MWLQQIDNGNVNWNDSEAKLKFCHALVGLPGQPTFKPKLAAPAADLNKSANDTITSSMSTDACADYNEGLGDVALIKTRS